MKSLYYLMICIIIPSCCLAQQQWSLQQCIDYALQNNLQVLQYQLRKNVQEKNLEIAKREKLPSVSGSFNNTLNFGQSQDVFGTIKRNDNFNNNANVGANILVYNNKRLEKIIKKTQSDVQASRYDKEIAQNNITIQIIQQYLSVLLNKEIYRINEYAFDNAVGLYNRAKITTEVGTTPQTVLAEAEASMAREKQNMQNAKISIERSLFSLSQLLALPDYKNFDVEEMMDDDTLTQYQPKENIVEEIYENQPQIKAAVSRINSAKAQVEVAKTAFFPTVTANAGVGTFYFNRLTTKDSNNFLQQYKTNFGQQLGFSTNIPIFNKGITKTQVEEAKINEEIAENILRQQKQEVIQSIQKIIFDIEANYQTYLAATEAEKSTKLALEFAEKSFNAGKTSIYDLNIARHNYNNARSSSVQAKYHYIFSIKILDFYRK